MTDKKRDYEAVISKELDEMLEQNPGLEKKPLYKLAGVLDDMTDYLGRIKAAPTITDILFMIEEKQLEPEDPNFEEMMAHFPLKLAAKKIEQYHRELKEILFELGKFKPH